MNYNYNKAFAILRGCVSNLLLGKVNEFDRVSMEKKIRNGVRFLRATYSKDTDHRNMPKSRFDAELNSIKNNFKTFLLS